MHGHGKLQPGQRGFTVIELMIVLVILAVLITVAAPGLQQMIVNNRLQAQASDLLLDLQYARAEASAKGQRITICKRNAAGTDCNNAGSWNDGWIVFIESGSGTTGTYESASPYNERILKVHDPIKTGDSLAVSSSPNFIYFRASGAVDAARTLTVCRSGYKGKTISITTTGRVSSTTTTCP